MATIHDMFHATKFARTMVENTFYREQLTELTPLVESVNRFSEGLLAQASYGIEPLLAASELTSR
ncbi:MAG: hypothetical protein ACPGWR_27640, partial [Ardenticatenaceae bacterium]